MNKHKEQKKALVLGTLATMCRSDGAEPYPAMKDIGVALTKNGDELKAKILTGGLTNFTYMIYTDSQDSKLFAKLSFPYSHIMPDQTCPLVRADSEFHMMKLFQEVAPGCAAVPYCCLDIKGDDGVALKLLVTEWVPSNEQFGNQFIDGAVDPRTATGLAQSLASLHCSKDKVAIDFNEEIRPYVSSIDPIIQMVLQGYLMADPAPDRICQVAQELSKTKVEEAFASYQSRVHQREHIIHADFHVFNIMVGAKPSPETLERFPPEGNVVICDWELSHVGPAGRDMGPFQAFPFACIFSHEINGNTQGVQDIMTFLDTFWKEYDFQLVARGKSGETDVCHAYRDSLVFCGLYMIAYAALGVHMNFLPIDGASNPDALNKVKQSIGVLGLKLFVLGSGSDPCSSALLSDLRSKVRMAVDEELSLLGAGVGSKPKRRRSSALRSSGVRVSDGHIHVTGMDRDSFIAMVNLVDTTAEEFADEEE